MQHQLPNDLLQSLEKVIGFDLDAFSAIHSSHEVVTSIRFNPSKKINTDQSVLSLSVKVPWSTNGYYLNDRPSFTLDPLFHAGGYYVQEASSMFLEEVLHQTLDFKADLKVLDLCAAPGGKSTLIQSVISDKSLLVSNEVIKTRVNILAENLTKWGAENVVITNNDPKDFQRLPHFFDVIVVDAPCSGSGLFRKDPDAVQEWSLDNVNLCSQRQQRILTDISTALKPGGILIYSTCSYSKEENENICDWLLADHPFESIKIKTQPDWNIIETQSQKNNGYGYRFYPNLLKGEGFFIAAFKKKRDVEQFKIQKSKTKIELLAKSDEFIIDHWINNKENLTFFKHQDTVIAFPENNLDNLLLIQQALYIKKAGIGLGNIIRKELIPSHDLAMSTLLNENILNVKFDLENALNYLRLQPFNYESQEKGWAIVKFDDLPLGFVKIMPNRLNNYYPKEWRIFNK